MQRMKLFRQNDRLGINVSKSYLQFAFAYVRGEAALERQLLQTHYATFSRLRAVSKEKCELALRMFT